jgi:hypothetical protein
MLGDEIEKERKNAAAKNGALRTNTRSASSRRRSLAFARAFSRLIHISRHEARARFGNRRGGVCSRRAAAAADGAVG